MSNIFDHDDEPEEFKEYEEAHPEEFFEESSPESYKDALVVAVYSQITHDLSRLNVQAVLDWLLSLDEDSLLHFLPQNNQVFKGTRPALNWFGSVEYTLLGDLADTIGLN